jgi:hypothetical protein
LHLDDIGEHGRNHCDRPTVVHKCLLESTLLLDLYSSYLIGRWLLNLRIAEAARP